MEIKRKYLQKYLHSIAIDQLIDEYSEENYIVSRDEAIGNFKADIVARKDKETIVIAIKTEKLTSSKRDTISGLADYLMGKKDYKFLIIVATPPKEKKLAISDIEILFSTYFTNEFPEELDSLSTHTSLDYVSDVDINEISIDGEYVFTKGSGIFNIGLQYGSDGDQDRGDGYETSDSIPFDFEITLAYNKEKKLEIVEVDLLKVDTSFFY